MSVKSPMSGTLTSIAANCVLLVIRSGGDRLQTVQGAGLSASMPYFAIASATFAAGIVAVLGQRLQRRDHDVRAAHLEEAAQVLARVAAPEAVGAEHLVAARHVLANLVGEGAHVVGRGDDRALRRGRGIARRTSARCLSVGCSRFQRAAAMPSRRSSLKLGQLQTSAATPQSFFSISPAAITSRRMVPLPSSCTRGAFFRRRRRRSACTCP